MEKDVVYDSKGIPVGEKITKHVFRKVLQAKHAQQKFQHEL